MRDLISAVRDSIGYLKGKGVKEVHFGAGLILLERKNEVCTRGGNSRTAAALSISGNWKEVGDRPCFTLKTSFVSVRQERARGIGCESNLCDVHSCTRDWGKQLAYMTFQGLSRAKTSLFRNGQAHREYACTSNIV